MADSENFRRWELPGTTEKGICGADIASAATIAPTHMFHTVTGTTTIDNITIPWAGFSGMLIIRATGALPLSASGNIAVAITLANTELAILFYVPAIGKWVGYVQNLAT